MAPMLKFIARAASAGAVVPVVFFVVSVAVPLFPIWLLRVAFVACPPYMLFMATAACEPFDACSLSTLALVVLLNSIFYALLGCVVFAVATHLKRRWGRPASGGAA